MVDPVVVVLVVVGARLVYGLAALWARPARERARAQGLAMVVRSAGPGAVVEVTCANGDLVSARPAAGAVDPSGAGPR
ncbi:hypothetical protein ACSMX9_15515 [Streptomyces sp. LE64]|uniref:hypothetical protein n=1 Tax=Streptomyces sp. LE64 TaxID=3448653 RepID=UPI004043515F